MVTTLLQPFFRYRVFNVNGDPGAFFKLKTFVAGTVDTPKATFQDFEGLVANTNPVIFNAVGEAEIHWATDGLYKIDLLDSLDNLQSTEDNYGSTSATGQESPNRQGKEKTVRLTATSGDTILSGTGADSPLGIFPAGSVPYGALLSVETSFGNGQGLTGLTVGTSRVTDVYGRGIARLAGTPTTPAVYTSYNPAPVPSLTDVVIRAEGGPFDGTGSLLVTVFYEEQFAVVTLP